MNIEGKKAFVLVDRMQARAHCAGYEEFRSLLASERNHVAPFHEHEPDQIIRKGESQLKRIEESESNLEDVTIADFFAWDRLGGRMPASGLVSQVGKPFNRMKPAADHIPKMKIFAPIFAGHFLPSIFCRGGRLEIDDGSPRAAAMHQNGESLCRRFKPHS